jgi:chemotaxis protein CheX
LAEQLLAQQETRGPAPVLETEEIVREIAAACQEVFTTMMGLHAVPGEAYVQKDVLGSADGVMSLIGLAGPWSGAGSIICSSECACKLAGRLLMTDYPAVNHEVLDAMAELTNMIVGNFKTLIEPRTGPLGLSIPSVVYGRNFTIRNGADDWTVLPIYAEDNHIEIRICLARGR